MPDPAWDPTAARQAAELDGDRRDPMGGDHVASALLDNATWAALQGTFRAAPPEALPFLLAAVQQMAQ
eukprot:6152135-Pyramimonas_sp.AAC.1